MTEVEDAIFQDTAGRFWVEGPTGFMFGPVFVLPEARRRRSEIWLGVK